MSSAAAAASSAASEAATAAELRAFTDGFQARALQIIYEVIPTKIDSLQAILTKFRALPCDAPVFTPTGAETNASISRLMLPIKAEIYDLLNLVDPLRMWVSLNIPRIQDQKGMAVSVKEDLVDMLHNGKVSALGLLESMTKFHVSFCAPARCSDSLLPQIQSGCSFWIVAHSSRMRRVSCCSALPLGRSRQVDQQEDQISVGIGRSCHGHRGAG